MKVIVVIPARYKSSRFPGKPLVPLNGKAMVLWVAELAARAVGQTNVYIATEDDRIRVEVESAGFHVVMTSDQALTGTDRVAEVAELVDADIYINLQGDEPLVEPASIEAVLDEKKRFPNDVINAYCPIGPDEDPSSINIPKVIFNESFKMVYMSRSLIPGYKDSKCEPSKYFKQVCIYAFTKDELLSFRAFGRKGVLEAPEDIEILRFLELERTVRMIEVAAGSLAIDVPSDVPPVEAALAKRFS